MNMSFEAELRRAEQTINRLIEAINRQDGAVYITSEDGKGFSAKLDKPIAITYFYMTEQEGLR